MTTKDTGAATLVIAFRGHDALVAPPSGGDSTSDTSSAKAAAATTVSARKYLPLVDAMVDNAERNGSGLPQFANTCQARADLLTTMSNTLAALTGLAIWASIEASPAWWAKAAMAFAALLSAVLGFLPGIYHWSDHATRARDLACRYGELHGDVLTIQGRIREGDEVSADDIKDARTRLETLKKQRQEINAQLPDPAAQK